MVESYTVLYFLSKETTMMVNISIIVSNVTVKLSNWSEKIRNNTAGYANILVPISRNSKK